MDAAVFVAGISSEYPRRAQSSHTALDGSPACPQRSDSLVKVRCVGGCSLNLYKVIDKKVTRCSYREQSIPLPLMGRTEMRRIILQP